MLEDITMLYVEDDGLSREAINLIARRLMNVKEIYLFSDSVNFLERARSLPLKPDIILLDIHLKPMDGFEMLKLLRASDEFKQSKIVAITASVMNEEVELLKQSGFDSIIGKPIQAGTFPDTIERILAGEAVWTVTG